MDNGTLSTYLKAEYPKDNRCTYRIKQEPWWNPYDSKWMTKYTTEFKRPGGWFWWETQYGYCFSYNSAVYFANRHAELRMGLHKKPEPIRVPIFHNLGKLP